MNGKNQQTIIAVSNGAAVRGCGCGEVVDGFEQVVRFNNAAVGPEYAADIGTRTTIWAHSDMPLQDEVIRQFASCRRLLASPHGKSVTPPAGAEEISPLLELRIRRRMRSVHTGVWVTTGLITLAYLLQEYETIHTLGWYCDEAIGNAHAFLAHYHESVETTMPLYHDIRAEARLFKQWELAGRLVRVDPE